MNRIIELQNAIDRACQCYVNENGRGGIADQEYNSMVRELRTLAPDCEQVKRVGAPISKSNHRKIVKHARVIGSLNDAMTLEEFRAWWPSQGCMASLKMDGLTIENTYVDGVLVSSATRGDGSEGEDVTANAIQMVGLPRQLASKFTGQVRGEAYMKLSLLRAINTQITMEGGETYSNVRNAASGIIRSTDGRFSDKLNFAAHGIYDPKNGLCIDRHFRAYQALRLLGLDVVESVFCEIIDEAIEYHTKVAAHRPSLDFWIDGVVFLINDLDAFQSAGVTNKRPKGGVAFKFPPTEVITTLKDVLVTVGHTGKLVPTAVLEPVEIDSTKVSNALLCNWEEIKRLGIGIADKVVVAKAGDIIPKIIRVSSKAAIKVPIPVPTSCPVCGGKVAKNRNTSGELSTDLYCQNLECEAKSTGKIARWIKSLDVKGIGDEVLLALTTAPHVQQGVMRAQGPMVHNISDLYRLKDRADQLATLPVNGKTFGKKRATSILAEIEKTRSLSVDQFLGSLGIDHLGKRRVTLIREAANGLLNEVGDWFSDYLLDNSNDLGIPGIAMDIHAGITAVQPLIEDLLRYITIKPIEAAPTPPTTGPMVGKTFAFTGCRADEVTAIAITSSGGAISEGLTKSCTHLVQKDPSKESSKSKKAKAWGLEVISLTELVTMLAAA